MIGWPSASTCRLIGRPSACAASRQRGAVSCAASRTTLLRSTVWPSCSGAARVNSSSRLTVSPPSRAACVVVVSKSSSSSQVRRILDQRLAGQVAVAGHEHQRLIEIVGDAGRHLAQRAQLLRLRHRLALLLGLLALGDVLGVDHDRLRRHEHVGERQFSLAARGPDSGSASRAGACAAPRRTPADRPGSPADRRSARSARAPTQSRTSPSAMASAASL